MPERGMIGIFNRSYYEDVLVVHVHPGRMEELPEKIGPMQQGSGRAGTRISTPSKSIWCGTARSF
jgi:hypothetical protein